ncbi:cytochrome c family protein [Ferrimonas balearica DSM 9799]|uniref:Cytochrome c family protein n=1 Tax=Ferrimonas balearica (strain DSM 9799 / CCM 4581 / KCTC 23876 / PAT) TaxID=550540 RepID=E1SVB2_FERBD|nr:c-type cytochrome [Ferrimonas balearica]MBY6019291.1 cytochrome c [Halomonas denitrificans]ADN74266.1 cytochrome c family protein [Ferrimonas balearica DSM 9799]MBW3141319.1 cytochrome c [Ferrimonas balearica]MBW3166177.1 cytochrome c [Ferrimonas balearica]MBY5981906.1 cytochrome c [Ferrimonas balearica]
MKTTSQTALAMLLLTLAAGAMAVDGGNPKKGKHEYKRECKACHTVGAEGGEITPMSKTMGQWDRFFQRDKHKAKPEVFEQLDPQKLLNIHQFLYDHAADSEQPATCG